MRRYFNPAIVALSALGLAGCGQTASDSADGGSSIDPAKAVTEMAFQFQPGKYRTTIDVQKVEMPGMPAGMGDQMKAMIAQKASSEYCVSPDQAVKGMELMKEQLGKGQCQFDSFKAAGGTVESVFTCQPGQGMSLRSASKGTYTTTGSQVAVTADMTIPGGKAMHIEQTVKMERIGDCT